MHMTPIKQTPVNVNVVFYAKSRGFNLYSTHILTHIVLKLLKDICSINNFNCGIFCFKIGRRHCFANHKKLCHNRLLLLPITIDKANIHVNCLHL